MKINFSEIYKVVTYYYPVDGKRKQVSKKFYQTLNPFNTIDGRPKTKDEIGKELDSQAIKWVVEMGKIHPSGSWKWKGNYL